MLEQPFDEYSKFNRIKKRISSPFLLPVLSILFPTVSLLEINSHIYTYDQIVTTIVFMLFVSIVTVLTAVVVVKYLVELILFAVKKLNVEFDSIGVELRLNRALLGGLGAIILLLLMHSAIRGLIPELRTASWVAFYLFAAIGISVGFYNFQLKVVNYVLCLLIAANLVALAGFNFTKESHLDAHKIANEIVFKKRPNVYMVVIESCTSLAIRNEIYGIDNSSFVNELAKYNFKLYNSVANYPMTLASLASIFLMDHHYYKTSRGVDDGGGYRRFLGGGVYNPVLSIFLKNGYGIDYSRFARNFYHPSSVISGADAQPLLQPLEVFSGVFLVVNRIVGCDIWGSGLFRALLLIPQGLSGSSPQVVRRVDEGKPLFSLIYMGAANHIPHTSADYPPEISSVPGFDEMPPWKRHFVNNYWIATYKKRMVESDATVLALVRNLAEKDPDAVVILLGDHGVRINVSRWMGGKQDVNENMLANGIQPAQLTRDYFEAFLAVKWPSGTPKPSGPISHVNLFRQVFAVLTEDDKLLRSQVPNDCYMQAAVDEKVFRIKNRSVYRAIKDGKILDRWQRVAQ